MSNEFYDNADCNNFVKDMHKANKRVEHYNGRMFWKGPAVRCNNLQEVLTETKVNCQWDSMGLGYIVYPVSNARQENKTSLDPRIIKKEEASFEITSGKIVAIDPCYSKDDIENLGASIEAENGKWYYNIDIEDQGAFWGTRVKELIIKHESFINKTSSSSLREMSYPLWVMFCDDVCVDSGQCGFFDFIKYQENQGGEYGDLNTFYGQACSKTHDENNPEQYAGTVMNFGAVSSSGFGDGAYEAFCIKNNDGKAIALKLVFISELDEENEEDDDDN